ncbi:MAG: glycosyltransferase family 2 protein [Treponema sp.]|nr:glycosyltransferase family 2 protein [Treponema sp.]
MKFLKKKINKWADRKIKYLNYVYKSEILNNLALNSNISGISTEKHCDNEIIISLTTFGKRLYEVYLTIESIMQQTLKPNRIILWISDNFIKSDIPLILQKQEKRGLEIKFCKDVYSYTKLIPALQAFPKEVIITIDDDYLYNFDLVENLFSGYKKNPNVVSCTRLRKMKLLGPRLLDKYSNWEKNSSNYEASHFNFPLGYGGVLYPPNCFNEEVLNEKIFTEICRHADDVWFKAMALSNDIMAQKVFDHENNGGKLLNNENTLDNSLYNINVINGLNDIQLKAVFDRYDLYKYLKCF